MMDRRRFRQNTKPAKGIDPFMFATHFCWDRRTANTVKPIASSNEVTVNPASIATYRICDVGGVTVSAIENHIFNVEFDLTIRGFARFLLTTRDFCLAIDRQGWPVRSLISMRNVVSPKDTCDFMASVSLQVDHNVAICFACAGLAGYDFVLALLVR